MESFAKYINIAFELRLLCLSQRSWLSLVTAMSIWGDVVFEQVDDASWEHSTRADVIWFLIGPPIIAG